METYLIVIISWVAISLVIVAAGEARDAAYRRKIRKDLAWERSILPGSEDYDPRW